MKPARYISIALIRRLIGITIVVPLIHYTGADKYVPNVDVKYTVPEQRKNYGIAAFFTLIILVTYLIVQTINEEKLEEELRRYDPSWPLERPP